MPTKPRFPATAAAAKRIVFQHTRGPLTGLYSILGLTTDLGLTADEVIPAIAEGFESQGQLIEVAGLVKVTTRYALFRQPIEPQEIQP
jgi:hypothetical protein